MEAYLKKGATDLKAKEKFLAAVGQFNQKKFKGLLDQFSESYFNAEEEVDDEMYDLLKEMYDIKFGPYQEVGAEPRGQKIPLPYYMGSLDKVRSQKEIDRFVKGHPGPYVLEDKVDGVSLTFLNRYNEKTKKITQQMLTRGKGVEGHDVSHIISALKLPKFKFDLAVRGELVMFNSDYEAHTDLGSNARAVTAGLVNRKDSYDAGLMGLLHFLAFRIFNTKAKVSHQIAALKDEYGFETPAAFLFTEELDREWLEAYLLQRRKKAPYNMDGLVIYQDEVIDYPDGDNPKDAVAFKANLSDEFVETTVTEVLWVPSKNRLLKPIIHYEPVPVPGFILRSTNGDNARYIVDNGIGVGAKILVMHSQGIIPRIVTVLEKAEPDLPDPEEVGSYNWNESGVELVLDEVTEEVRMAQVKAFFNKMKVEKMKEGRIKALFNAGFDTLEKILRATPKQLANVERMGEKSAQSLVDQLKDVLVSKPLTTVMAASSLFPGFGERKIDVILAVYPNLLEMEESPEELADLIAQIHGFGQKSIKFTSQLALFKEWLEEHPMIQPVLPTEEEQPAITPVKSPQRKAGASPQRKAGASPQRKPTASPQRKPTASPQRKPTASPQKIRPPTKTGDLTGFQVVFSGFRDAAAQKQIEARGGKVTTAVSGKTTHLVLGDDSEMKGKAVEAQKKGAQIVRWSAFKRQYGL